MRSRTWWAWNLGAPLRRTWWCWFLGACLMATACEQRVYAVPSRTYATPTAACAPAASASLAAPNPCAPAVAQAAAPDPCVPVAAVASIVTWEAWSSVALGASVETVLKALGPPRSDAVVDGYRTFSYNVMRPAVGVVTGLVRFSAHGSVMSRVDW